MTESDEHHPLAERIASSVDERLHTDENSRRSFLRRSALVGGTLLALGGGTGVALAQSDEAEDMAAMFDDVDGTDVDVLNYALTLEHLESAFYREVLDTFSEDHFAQANVLQDWNESTRRRAYHYVQAVGEHEAAHVDVLTQAVELLGGDPAMEGSYNFGVESVSDALSLGQVLENTGVAAYAGAAPFVESPDLLGAALSIHSVEARHAAFLNQLNGESPAPDAFDPAQSQEEVLGAVRPLIASSGGDGNGETTPTPAGDESG